MDIWFSLIGGAIGRMFVPGVFLIGGYVFYCKRWRRPINSKIVYYLASALFLMSLFGALGDIWDSPALRGTYR